MKKEETPNKRKNPKCKCHPCTCEPICTCGLDEYEKETIEELSLELQSARAAAQENLNLAKYQKAEFENYKKRNAQLVDNALTDGKTVAILSLLPVLDSYAEALKRVTTPGDREGFEMLWRKFEQTLSNMGVEEITANIGDKFSYDFHNAVAAGSETGKQAGTILEIWQKGYKMGGRVIRPVSVKVAE